MMGEGLEKSISILIGLVSRILRGNSCPRVNQGLQETVKTEIRLSFQGQARCHLSYTTKGLCIRESSGVPSKSPSEEHLSWQFNLHKRFLLIRFPGMVLHRGNAY